MKFLLPIFVFCAFVNLSAQPMHQPFEELIQNTFPEDGPGAAVLVTKGGETIYESAVGFANLELDVAMQSKHVFRIGSITKQFTACAILHLVEEGELSLTEPITKYIPDYPTQGHTITIEHLLTHTSGIKSYTNMGTWTAEVRRKDFSPKALIDLFKDEPMDFAPGEAFSYNNSGYVLLGYIIEQISGQTYAEYLQQTFFEPLGMNNTYYGDAEQLIPNRATGYEKNGDSYQNSPYLSMTQPYAAGSLLSTTQDLHTWYEAVMSGKVISKASLANAHQPYQLNDSSPVSYGYGWFLGNIQGSPMIDHGGGINGFLSASLYLPEEAVFVSVLTNCTCQSPEDLAHQLAALAINKPFVEPEIVELSADQLETYTGVYERTNGQTRVITLQDGQLYSQRNGGARYAIYPMGEDRFFFEGGGSVTLDFKRKEKGEIHEVVAQGVRLPENWTLLDREIPVAPQANTEGIDEALLAKYVGTYQLIPNFNIVVTVEGVQLYVQATGQPRFATTPLSRTKFAIDGVDAQIIFKLEEGAIQTDGLTLLQNGTHQAKRID